MIPLQLGAVFLFFFGVRRVNLWGSPRSWPTSGALTLGAFAKQMGQTGKSNKSKRPIRFEHWLTLPFDHKKGVPQADSDIVESRGGGEAHIAVRPWQSMT